MKICSALFFLFIRLLFSYIPFTAMAAVLWKSVILEPMSDFAGYVNARCIHDNLDHPTSGPSPQTYQQLFYKEHDEVTAKMQPKSSSAEFLNSNEYHYYYNYDHYGSGNTEENPVTAKLSDLKETTSKQEKDISQLPNYRKSIPLSAGNEQPPSHRNGSNTSIKFERLKQGLDRATEQIALILSVIPVQGALLLSRHDICQGYWQDLTAPNKGKCGKINPGYSGEICLDDFQIPDEHLSGFETYDRNNSDPIETLYVSGSGLNDTDTVIYVRSENTPKCQDGGIIAYATYCQLDQYNRPVAGYANFCPNHLSSDLYEHEKLYLTVLHEFFHVLGFSQKLFDKFQDCQFVTLSTSQNDSAARWDCEPRGEAVDYVDDWYRILTPAVRRESKEHFNCSRIAGPLESDTTDKKKSSHWESRYIQPSLMTSTLGLPHLTILDRITLAVFQDSGWYRVNMSQATELFWGKNAGCEFGSEKYCHAGDSPFFCTASDFVSGCHYLHFDKGVCSTNDFLDSCRVYKPAKKEECWDVKEYENKKTGEVFNINSRCFVSNLSIDQEQYEEKHHIVKRNSEEQGRCYEHRCNDTKTLEIRLSGTDWVICPSYQFIKIRGFEGRVLCPSAEVTCHPAVQKRIHSASASAICVNVNISFRGLQKFINSPLPLGVTKESRYTQIAKQFFHDANVIIKATGASLATLPAKRGDVMYFSLKALQSLSGSCAGAINMLKLRVLNKTLNISVENTVLTATHIQHRYTLVACTSKSYQPYPTNPSESDGDKGGIDKDDKYKPGPGLHSGIIAASVIGVVCVGVFASVGGILYWKSLVPRAIGPSTGSAPEISYQPNSNGSPISGSENGSFGQMQFPV
ncbi:ciliated left-right organizer metallopeptidase-like isoform X2 [Clavelina lepadiformis]|uniref:ciliated left-right organizer metallopeptidase-like isoform X2 n=1 Tax=Clavelina lepadiformis TaxID=159417 RepID=UPI0040431F19